MMGSVLIYGGSKKDRLERAYALLAEHGFKPNTQAPDLLIIEKESEKKSIGIAKARDLRDFMRERPFNKKVKIGLIEDAQLLTEEAQNSLLKLLEEPPAFCLILLLCDKEGALLPTIISRCQRIAIRAGVSASHNISNLSYEEIFDLAKSLSEKGKDESIEFLEQVLSSDLKSGVSLDIVEKVEKSLREIKEANVAVKFALEYLFLLHKLRM